jgi:SOS-response transcriptional repressor LexA
MRSYKGVSPEEKEESILKFINNYKEQNGFSPSIREICKSVDIHSTSTVHTYLHNLIGKGLITSLPEMPRTINLKTERYKNEANVIKINQEMQSVPFIFNLSKSSLNILDQYCKIKSISADEAINRALQALAYVGSNKKLD